MENFMLSVCVFVLASCGAHVSDDISKKYNERVRQLELTPVYPPREEVQVGDLFLNSQLGKSDEHAVRQYITTIPAILALAQQNLDSRVVFTASSKSGSAAPSDDTIGFQDDLTGGRILTRRGGRNVNNSLPLAVFPEITANAGNDLGVGILAPLAALGLFAGSRTTVTLGFHDVRTYFAPPVDADKVARLVVCGRLPLSGAANYDMAFVKKAADAVDAGKYSVFAGAAQSLRERHMFYRVVTRVYLTRKITYTYRNARLLSIARRNLTVGSDGKAPTFPSNIVTVNVNPAGTTAAASTDVNNALNDLKAQTATTPEGERFVSFNALGLTIERIFKQPVAVAFDGIEYEPDRAALNCDSVGVVAGTATNVRSSPTVAPPVVGTVTSAGSVPR